MKEYNSYGDAYAVALEAHDFERGGLRVASYARPGKLFTANRDLLIREVGKLKNEPLTRIIDAIVTLLRQA